jgi:DNA-binding PadR family transcriptional regulator
MSLTHALIGLLSGGPLHGYEIKQRFASSMGGEWSISYGQLYPALARLTDAGFISKTSQVGEKTIEKHVYTVTPDGAAYLHKWLASPFECQVRVKDELTLRLANFGLVHGEDRTKILLAYRDQVAERLKSIQLSLPSFDDRWLSAIAERAIGACKWELRWLDDILKPMT